MVKLLERQLDGERDIIRDLEKKINEGPQYITECGTYFYGLGAIGRKSISHDQLFKMILHHLNLEIKINPATLETHSLEPKKSEEKEATNV